MAEEKRVNIVIDGDASGLQEEIERVGKRASNSFKELGFDEVFDEAAEKFEKRIEQLQYIMDELKRDREDTERIFNERIRNSSNDAARNRLTKEKEERIGHIDRSMDALRKAIENHTKKLESGKVDESGNPIEKPKPNTPPKPDPKDDDDKRVGNDFLKGIIDLLNGRINTGFRSIFRNFGRGGGGGGVEGGEVAAAEEGGAAAGAGGLMASIPLAAIVASVFLLGKKAWKDGAEDLRQDNRLRALGAERDSKYWNNYDYGDFSSLGVNRTEAKKMMQETLKGVVGLGMEDRTGGVGIKDQAFDISLKKLQFETAYGIETAVTSKFDQFYRQDKYLKTPTNITAEMIDRNANMVTSAGGTMLGSLANEKLSQIAKLLEQQKQHAERVDSRLAISLLAAGNKIGGQFGDDRGGDKIGGIVNSLSAPKGDLMKSLMFSMLSQKYGSISETLAAIEGIGSNSEDLSTVTKGLSERFGNGEMSKLIFGSQFGSNPNSLGSQVDVNKFFSGGGFGTINKSINEGSDYGATINARLGKVFDNLETRAKNLTLNTDALQVKANNVSIVTGRVMNSAVGNDFGDIKENAVTK